MRLVLASSSPRRKDMLQRLGLDIEVLPVGIDEGTQQGEDPIETAIRLARAKARAGHEARPRFHVLGADTIVVSPHGDTLGKPASKAEAKAMLRVLSGDVHEVITGFCIVSPEGEVRSDHTSTKVEFKELDEKTIEWYVATGEPLDKAGAYGIQGKASVFVKAVQGSYTNVVGLPLSEIMDMLAAMGWKGFPPGNAPSRLEI